MFKMFDFRRQAGAAIRLVAAEPRMGAGDGTRDVPSAIARRDRTARDADTGRRRTIADPRRADDPTGAAGRCERFSIFSLDLESCFTRIAA